MWTVRQSQTGHTVRGCHIQLRSARAVTEACLCADVCTFGCPPASNGVQSGLLSALRRRAVTALFFTCFRLRDTQLCTQCVCSGSPSWSRQCSPQLIYHAFKSIPLQSVYQVASQRVIRRGKVDSAMIETKSQTQRVR